MKIYIIGGGAAGFFGAIRCAQRAKDLNLKVSIDILEASPNFLKKVRISGGGRCNVTHHIYDSNKFSENYPRGSKELKSPFSQFQALNTVEWFKERGVDLVAESDGRMFPKSNSSETIIDCFLNEAKKLGVNYKPNLNVQAVSLNKDKKFLLTVRNEEQDYACDKLLIATGSSPVGYKLAKSLGHKITNLAPSLFSFKLEDSLLQGLSGTSFKEAEVYVKIDGVKKNFKQRGPVLITHWGLSGPAVLKISAWAARELKESNYKGRLVVNWLGLKNSEVSFELLKSIKSKSEKSLIKNNPPEGLTKAFWEKVLIKNDFTLTLKWMDLSYKDLRKIAEMLTNYSFEIKGKNRYKDEFVECGGVSLKEINFKTMESKVCNNLYFAGEILDIDGITGGFNFQNAWTTSWLAANDIMKQ